MSAVSTTALSPRRPVRYGEGVCAAICQRLVGGESLTTICAEDGMPAYSTVMLWLSQREDFRRRYGRARHLQAHALADEVLVVLRDDSLPSADKQARMKGLTWMAAKLAPAKYGDRPQTDQGVGEPVLTIIVKE